MRTASTKIAALSVLGVLPGSKIEPNSKNLVDIPNTECESLGEAHRETETKRDAREYESTCHLAYPFATFPYMLWS
jgi:hypothetical protein